MSEQKDITMPMESMADYEEEIARSFKRLKQGDIVTVTVLDIKEDAVMVDLGSYTEGIIPNNELSDDPKFSVFSELKVGDVFPCYVLSEDDGNGNVVLSKKQAHEILAWEQLREDFTKETPFIVTVQSIVNGGVIAYLNGIRGFIPASQLSLHYVENLEDWVNKSITVQIITVEEEKKKLVLSAKIVEQQVAKKEQQEKLSHVQKGIVTTGIVEKIVPYGAFVTIGDGLTGLVHISKMSNKRIKSPNEVVKLGDEVTVKIVDVADGKISLDMKVVLEEHIVEEVEYVPVEFLSEEDASTSLASLLTKFKL